MILLIQFRNDQSGWHELKCIYNAIGGEYSQIQVINLYADNLSLKGIYKLTKVSKGIILGGLGSLSYGEKVEAKRAQFNKIRNKALSLLKKLLISKKNPPILGMCFGHQLIAEALGSDITPDKNQGETGTFEIKLTSKALIDPLYKGIPPTFYAIEGHKDSIQQLPKNTILLCYSNQCKIQSFKYKNNVYGVQFHPEMDTTDLKFRLSLYPSYSQNSINIDTKIKINQTKKILKNFLKLCS